MPIIIILITAVVAFFSGYLVVSYAPNVLIAGSISLAAAVFAFFSTKLSLVLLIFSTLLSPEIPVGSLGGGRTVVFRYDDILLIIIFFSWFFKNAVFKNRPFVFKTPLQTPLLIYTSVFIISTFLGVLRGDIYFYRAIFYALKYIEYFLFYFMCVNIIDKEDIQKYMKYWAIVFLAVTAYAYYYYFNATGKDIRATAPFEAPLDRPEESEPASLGGFYLIAFSFLLSVMTEYSGRIFILAVAAFVFAFPAFLYTYSRASYIGFTFIAALFFFFARKRKLLIGGLMFFAFFLFAFSPKGYEKVRNRISGTYSGSEAVYSVEVLGANIKLEESAYLRYSSLKRVITDVLPKYPLVGRGVTGIGLGDNQYALLLGEIGIIGFLAFWFWVSKAYKMAFSVYKNSSGPEEKTFALTAVLSISGLLMQGLGVNSFIIVRIMEPFWFMMAVLTVINSKDETGALIVEGESK